MASDLNILLAEDNADDVFLLKRAFKKAETTDRFWVVGDGLEALAYLKGEGIYSDRGSYPFPDFLLLDLNMPRMNGFEVLDWVRHDATCSHLMVHVLTASSRKADVQRAYALRANSYVMKPSRLDELADLVRTLHNWHRRICLPIKPGETIEECIPLASTPPLAGRESTRIK